MSPSIHCAEACFAPFANTFTPKDRTQLVGGDIKNLSFFEAIFRHREANLPPHPKFQCTEGIFRVKYRVADTFVRKFAGKEYRMIENPYVLEDDSSKEEKYHNLVTQIDALVSGESDLIANLANVAAALKQTFGFFWVGFYLVKNGVLVLGPFQGLIACTRIAYGQGVCGTAWKKQQTLVVPDVELFPGHIACSSKSKSEIVVPLLSSGKVVGVLDIDSDRLNDFDETDATFLEAIVRKL
jgi:GAF domain-containing protein